MREKRVGKDKNSVSEEWYDKGFVKDKSMENNQLAAIHSDGIPKYQSWTSPVKTWERNWDTLAEVGRRH